MYVPLRKPSGGTHEDGQEEETKSVSEISPANESAPIQGMIKLDYDETELVYLRLRLNVYIWSFTFAALLLITAILYVVFRQQNMALVRKNIELETANKNVSKALEAKTEFLNQAAHDLKTPLTPILTLLQILQKSVKDKKNQHNITVVRNNAKYLDRIVNEIINLARTQATEFEYNFQKTDLEAQA